MPRLEFESQVAFEGKLRQNRENGLPEAVRALALLPDYMGYIAACGEGCTTRAYPSAIQRMASGSPSRAANYLPQLHRSYCNPYVQKMFSEVSQRLKQRLTRSVTNKNGSYVARWRPSSRQAFICDRTIHQKERNNA